MPSPIFQDMPQGNDSLFSQIRQAMNGNPQGLFDQMYRTNPAFRDLANSVKGKTPEQAFSEHGLDFNDVRRRFGR